ncbi:DEAD/DEAH box helicase [Virgibacillus halodenitrificans]|uniref:DEAD/DEAH box helicase n=1 Tax=Virgibacillus halodenitrificans TaxID=1482 RepID=A0ABR7VKB9_VIRHA|nr:DEAD/DEAH box helicase [Virgibacillus halodenitrificans]MBD1222369.1 DEAD/DEAH box helicase [Virgibacillus halodenitrificans]
MEPIRKLIRAINLYDESTEKFEELRDLVCEISDKKIGFSDPLTKELLFMASQKMRTFGYNVLNNISLPEDVGDNNISFVYKNEVINQFYSSRTGVQLDKFQKEIIDTFTNLVVKRILVSAPTSFGKTFILKEMIFQNIDQYQNVLLIFPTLSLLEENITSFRTFIKQHGLNYNIVSNTHMEFEINQRNLFILTPERVLKILNENPDLNFNFFFLDEIYKIDNFFETSEIDEQYESERDRVFRIILYLLSKTVQDFYLAGPYINLENIGEGLTHFINKNAVKTIQIKTELVSKEHIPAWTKRIYFNKDNYIEYEKSNSKYQKLRELLKLIEKRNMGPTIVYAGTKPKVTEIARESVDTLNKNENITPELQMFINHLERRYSVSYKKLSTHLYWTIITLLKRGMGIHHGSFPKYIQSAVLEFFNNGELKVLFTTTSITEGVNTNAKNIIFYGKKKGIKDLRTFDIKNINGRAGRYYHHFLGRIFYLEKSVYDKLQQEDEKLDFITFSDKKLSDVDIDNTDKEDLTDINRKEKEKREEYLRQFNIDDSVFVRNRLVDKVKQVKLIQYLANKDVNELESTVNECSSIRSFLKHGTIYSVLGSFEKIGMINEYDVSKYGVIASTYSKENGMFNLLQYQLNKQAEDETLNNELVDKIYIQVFSNIRNIIEFRVPKFLSIYASLLEYVCNQKNIDTESLAFESIIRFFELGVKTSIGMFLVENGFPVTSIRILEKNIPRVMEYEVNTLLSNWDDIKLIIRNELDEYELRLFSRIISNVG